MCYKRKPATFNTRLSLLAPHQAELGVVRSLDRLIAAIDAVVIEALKDTTKETR